MYNPIFLVVGDKRKNEEQNILILPVVHFIIPSVVIYSKNKKKVQTFLDKNTIRIISHINFYINFFFKERLSFKTVIYSLQIKLYLRFNG